MSETDARWMVEVFITREPCTNIPWCFDRVFKEEFVARRWFDGMNPGAQIEAVRLWVSRSGKKADFRAPAVPNSSSSPISANASVEPKPRRC